MSRRVRDVEPWSWSVVSQTLGGNTLGHANGGAGRKAGEKTMSLDQQGYLWVSDPWIAALVIVAAVGIVI
jgi:hypothetical protein